MPRFFVDPKEVHPSFMVLTGENAAHARVLRLKDGDSVTVTLVSKPGTYELKTMKCLDVIALARACLEG